MTGALRKVAGVLCASGSAAALALLLCGSSNGAWLHRVSAKDHARTNPLARPELQERAASAGAELFENDCAKCHGNGGQGLHGRPAVVSDRIAAASDGDLFWLMTNGSPWRGMPPWMELPATERWQLVSYLRAMNGGAAPATEGGR
jgi:mono/diheme cytochrome c family protein